MTGSTRRLAAMKSLVVVTAVLAGIFAGNASAQIGWAGRYTEDNSKIPTTGASSSNNETDIGHAQRVDGTMDDLKVDLNHDGFVDLVIVRKEPFTSTGKRTNYLWMNVNGVFQNQTSTYASSSTVSGDNGFNTSTNDRDVIAFDADQDGWQDLVTATTLSDGDPKYIGHPRIYMNEGADNSGNWNGLIHDEPRFPQLLHFGTNQPQNPRFCSVGTGDTTGNGYPDLVFGDYDSSGAGGSGQGSNEDMNMRLCENDGNGFYSDASQARMSSTMLNQAFGASINIDDMNGDGVADILKQTSLNAPQHVAVVYNQLGGSGSQGTFNNLDQLVTDAPYHTNTGDLNNDGRLDWVKSDDNTDRFYINTGNDSLGRANFSTGSYSNGNDDGFSSNNMIIDIDGDGWADVAHADVDVDISGCGRYNHIFHNQGGSVGGMPTIRRESGSGWNGLEGLTTSDLQGTHDFAFIDIDNDGDRDFLNSRCADTTMWISDHRDGACYENRSYGPNEKFNDVWATLSVEGPFQANQPIDLIIRSYPNVFGAVLVGSGAGWLGSWQHGTYLLSGPTVRVYFTTDANGDAVVQYTPTSAGQVNAQALNRAPTGPGLDNLQHSNAIEVQICN